MQQGRAGKSTHHPLTWVRTLPLATSSSTATISRATISTRASQCHVVCRVAYSNTCSTVSPTSAPPRGHRRRATNLIIVIGFNILPELGMLTQPTPQQGVAPLFLPLRCRSLQVSPSRLVITSQRVNGSHIFTHPCPNYRCAPSTSPMIPPSWSYVEPFAGYDTFKAVTQVFSGVPHPCRGHPFTSSTFKYEGQVPGAPLSCYTNSILLSSPQTHTL
mgnify:CR=1 FL=1